MTQEANRIRVVHLTTVHSPFDVRIFHKECVTLADAGFDVTLVQRSDKAEIVKGVRIAPLPTYGSRLARMTLGVWRAVRLARRHRPHVVHFHDAELIWGALFLKLGGSKVVYDIHENLHLDIAAKQWIPAPLKPVLGLVTQAVEYLAVALFDQASAATDGIASRFPDDKVTVVRNAPRLALYGNGGGDFATRPPCMIYIGGLGGGGDVKGVDLMLDALAALPDESPIRLKLGGPEPHPGFIEGLKRRPGGERIDYLGWVDQCDIPAHYAQSIGALVLYPPMPNNVESEPVKLFESMAAGVPSIISDFPLFTKYMDQWQCGFAVDAFDSGQVAQLMQKLHMDRALARQLGANGREAAERERNWDIFGERLVALYERLVPQDASWED